MKATTAADYERRILRVLTHIQANLDEPMHVEGLAGIASFSPYHFHRIFRGMVGETVIEHVRRLRLERAAFQLSYGKRRVTDISLDAGYDALEAFSRAFKTVFGCSPSAYRSATAPARPSARSGVHYSADGCIETFTPVKGDLAMDVTVTEKKPQAVAFVRHTGPYEEVGPTWERLCAWAGPKGLITGETKFIGVSYDDPGVTEPDKIRYDACISLDRPVLPEGDIGVQELPGGTFAVTVHKGPYSGLKDAYDWLMGTWLADSGYEAGGCPTYEVYLNAPDKVPPEELRTEINLPLSR